MGSIAMRPYTFAKLRRKVRERRSKEAIVMATIAGLKPHAGLFSLKALDAYWRHLISGREMRLAVKCYEEFSQGHSLAMMLTSKLEMEVSAAQGWEQRILTKWPDRHKILETLLERFIEQCKGPSEVRPVQNPIEGKNYYRPAFTETGVSRVKYVSRIPYCRWLARNGYLFPSTEEGKLKAKSLIQVTT